MGIVINFSLGTDQFKISIFSKKDFLLHTFFLKNFTPTHFTYADRIKIRPKMYTPQKGPKNGGSCKFVEQGAD